MAKDHLPTKFHELTGSYDYFEPGNSSSISTFLQAEQLIAPDEEILSCFSAGAGNMNVTLRVITDRQRLILKQSRPWVAKYPDIPAPIDRIFVESDYLQATREEPILAQFTPKTFGVYHREYAMAMEDISDATDLSVIYAADQALPNAVLRDMLAYLSALHRLPAHHFPENKELRTLNHAHIFDLPFRPDNGFPLDELLPGLAAVAKPLQHDDKLRAAATALGDLYLGTSGRALIHGDFYPGSLLNKDNHLYVIDGEFAFRGLPEFDLGVLLAHLLLAQVPEEQLKMIDTHYGKPPEFDAALVRRFAYVEIIRRLIGIAPLPLALSLEERQRLLAEARRALVWTLHLVRPLLN